MGGRVFFYVEEKAVGTSKQTRTNQQEFEASVLGETINRLCRFADSNSQNMMAVFDQVNESQRVDQTSKMYAHVFSRMATHREMRRLIEPPMHLDSSISSNIQFADWLAACVFRTVDRQLIIDTKYDWASRAFRDVMNGNIANESKLHIRNTLRDDFHHIRLFSGSRPMVEGKTGYTLLERDPLTAEKMARVKAAGERRRRT